MRCIRREDVEVSREVMDRYDLDSPQGRLDYILEERDGFAPVFSNRLFAALGGAVRENRVAGILYGDIDEFLVSPDLSAGEIRYDILSEARIYSLDGIFTTLTSLLDMSMVLRLMRRDLQKLERVFEKVERNFISYVEILASYGVRRFSYADPAALPEVLGGHYERWIAGRFMKVLRELLQLPINIHICPLLFNEIQGEINTEGRNCAGYQETFFQERSFGAAGGSCIKNKGRGIYYFAEREEMDEIR